MLLELIGLNISPITLRIRAYPKTINHNTLCIWSVVFEEIDDKLWAMVQPYFPPQKPKTGRPRCDLRKTFNGIPYVHGTGTNWSDAPRMYGTKSTVHKLHMDLLDQAYARKLCSEQSPEPLLAVLLPFKLMTLSL